MSGILFIAAGVGLIELFRRGYLTGIVDGVKAAAAGKPAPASLYSAPSRPFTLPGAGNGQVSLGGNGGRLS